VTRYFLILTNLISASLLLSSLRSSLPPSFLLPCFCFLIILGSTYDLDMCLFSHVYVKRQDVDKYFLRMRRNIFGKRNNFFPAKKFSSLSVAQSHKKAIPSCTTSEMFPKIHPRIRPPEKKPVN